MAEVAEALFRVFSPRKLNYEALGNSVPHLHWWLTPRYVDDPRPHAPIWEDLDFLRAQNWKPREDRRRRGRWRNAESCVADSAVGDASLDGSMRARIRTVIRGAIVAESLRLGAVVEEVSLVVHKIERVDAGLDEQPPQWTIVWFEAADEDAGRLAEALADALEARGGWYADFHSDSEVTVVFSGCILQYRRGDQSERARVVEYACFGRRAR